ncbi:MAG TPA: hypothetical protein VF297_31835 [Pyrinomonadaceae bacterium]
MTAQLLTGPRFVRKTQLGPGEYRKNFRQLDGDVITAVTSPEADRVTPLMSKVYLRLVHAPAQYWERDGVLRFEAELRGDSHITAWAALCEAVGVASATARKALRWMHEEGIIGYFSGKNGVGIRIFLNRAASSIGAKGGQKILDFPRTSSSESRASRDEAAFSDSFADLEVLDTDGNPRAPKSGAGQAEMVKPAPDPNPICPRLPPQEVGSDNGPAPRTALRIEVPVEEIVSRLRRELEPSLRLAASQAAAREHERTREWLESRGLPKAARVAQHEAYNVLRSHGLIGTAAGRARAGLEVGRGSDARATAARPLTPEEVAEAAETCVALFEAQGKSVDVTLSEISSEGRGWLLPEDAPRVREAARELLGKRCERR